MRQLLWSLAPAALIVVACGGTDVGSTEADPATTAAAPTTEATTTVPALDLPEGSLPEGPSALRDMRAEGLPEPLVDPSEIIPGGPPPDGIPPIDEPVFTTIEDAAPRMTDEEAVVVLESGGDARAYPVEILIWHEIVNDTVGGTPVSITYCPLCNTAVSYQRVINGVETTFGTSGRLFASALVMYDRATESLWTHFDGRAVVGVLTGYRLDPIPSPLLAWADFVAAYPDGKVLDRSQTGFVRPYGQNPYVGYDNPDTSPFLFRGEADARAAAKQRVVGVAVGDGAKAWSLEAISGGEAKATHGEVGDQPIVIFWKAGQVSALEGADTAKGRDIGSVGVFSPVVDGRTLTFEASAPDFTDRETGSTWDITGTAIDGELAGATLERIHHFDTFWFAWSTYQPGTELIEG